MEGRVRTAAQGTLSSVSAEGLPGTGTYPRVPAPTASGDLLSRGQEASKGSLALSAGSALTLRPGSFRGQHTEHLF